MHRKPYGLFLLLISMLLFLSSCASKYDLPPDNEMLAYTVEGKDLLREKAPVFVITNPEMEYNLIGSPKAELTNDASAQIVIDPGHATLYAEARPWQSANGNYTNIIYRVHFQQIPFKLIPFHLGAGKNIGLFVIITFNKEKQPLLITTLHTCGCYLSFTPTSFLSRDYFPDNWQLSQQQVYGEYLPGILNFADQVQPEKLHVFLRKDTHRIRDLQLVSERAPRKFQVVQAEVKALDSLNKLHTTGITTTSFFETEGARKEYVVGSQKIWERLFISWWALDWRVGEDKRLGQNREDGKVFYTSLKPWARQASDLRDFASFLNYWGWKL
jgi:hypothetical protein